MKWVNHVAIGASVASLGGFELIAPAAAGAVFPDLAERFLPVKHRQETHYLFFWVAGLAVSLAAWIWTGEQFIKYVCGFAFGGLSHVLTDALTISGVPSSPWADNRFHLLGGRLRTGQPAEYIISAICIGFAFLVHSALFAESGFYPFFYDWGGLYDSGLIDGHEWKQNRLKFF